MPCKIEGSDRLYYDGDIVFEDKCHSWYVQNHIFLLMAIKIIFDLFLAFVREIKKYVKANPVLLLPQ